MIVAIIRAYRARKLADLLRYHTEADERHRQLAHHHRAAANAVRSRLEDLRGHKTSEVTA